MKRKIILIFHQKQCIFFYLHFKNFPLHLVSKIGTNVREKVVLYNSYFHYDFSFPPSTYNVKNRCKLLVFFKDLWNNIALSTNKFRSRKYLKYQLCKAFGKPKKENSTYKPKKKRKFSSCLWYNKIYFRTFNKSVLKKTNCLYCQKKPFFFSFYECVANTKKEKCLRNRYLRVQKPKK